MTKPKAKIPPKVLRRDGAKAYVALGDTQFDEYVESGDLPPPIDITDGGRAKAWLVAELDAWLAERIAKRDAALAARKPPPVKRSRPGPTARAAAAKAAASSPKKRKVLGY